MNHSRGDRRADGMIFWRLVKYSGSIIGERWITEQDYEKRVNRELVRREKNRTRSIQYRLLHPEKSRSSVKLWKSKNKNKVNANARAWRLQNADHVKEWDAKWRAKRKSDGVSESSFQKFKRSCRTRAGFAIRGKSGTKKETLEHIGCSWMELRQHLESKFQDGMTWENYGRRGWHVDHKIPLSLAKTTEELLPLLHYTNLQPLWWHQNLSKGDKLQPTQFQ